MEEIINVDLVNVYDGIGDEPKLITTLAYGDEVDVIEKSTDYIKIKVTGFKEQDDGSIEPELKDGFIILRKKDASEILINKSENKVLKVDFVDVQQGDGCVIETPDGKVMLIDGGDNQLFARYLANRFRDTTPDNPKEIECIVISHGDADHFNGLTEIYKSKDYDKEGMKWKQLFIHPKRVYHQGLIKYPGKDKNGIKIKDVDLFGKTVKIGDKLIITELYDDIRTVNKDKLNKDFSDWQDALNGFPGHETIECKRIKQKDDNLFGFLNEGITVNVLAPIISEIDGVTGLEMLHDPKSHGHKASHTVNGHSVVLKIKFGNVSFLFGGDLNEESGNLLQESISNNGYSLKSEVFKVPHHGSADFSGKFIEAVNPLVSIVSSGDEGKDFIHPRATLMSTLGRYSRIDKSAIFVTELVAFFKKVGAIKPEIHKMKNDEIIIKDGEAKLLKDVENPFFAFKRTAFGIVKVRTNGKRLLVYTNSGQDNMKESYAYEIENEGSIKMVEVKKV